MTQNVNSQATENQTRLQDSKEMHDHDHHHDHEHEHEHDHDHSDELAPIEVALEATATAEDMSFDSNIAKTLELCAEQGWRANFYFKDGSTFMGGFITSADFDKGAVVTERMGERHLKPRLIFFRDLSAVEADWTGK